MPRKIAQVRMDDHQIDDPKLLGELEKWDKLDAQAKKARDAYAQQDKEVKGLILAKKGLPTGKRLRCGPYVVRLKDEKAREVKSRLKAKGSVKIERAAQR